MRITKLDGLRGVFSLMVVFYHYKLLYLPDPIYNNPVIRESYTFVDFFFVLSGFVIAYNYNSISTYKDFWIYLKKRVARLYPLLFFTSTLFLIYRFSRNIIQEFSPSMYKFTQDEVLPMKSLLLEYAESLMFTNSSPVFGIGQGINPPTWSISAEMISYTVFGLISIYAIGKGKKVLLFLVILLSILFCIYYGSLFMSGDYGFVRGLISFNLGYFVWLVSKMKFKLNNNLEYVIPVILVLIFYILNSYPEESETKGMIGLITIPIFFAISILILLKTNGLLSKALDTRPLQFLGETSYSIYLNHYLFISLIPQVLFGILKIPQNTMTELIVFTGVILFVIIYSKYTYKYVEVNGGKFLRKLLLK